MASHDPASDDRAQERRHFLKSAAIALGGVACGIGVNPDVAEAAVLGTAGGEVGAVVAVGRGKPDVGATQRASALRLGVASYSLRNFPRPKAVDMLRSLGVHYVNLKSVHLPVDADAQEIGDTRAALAAAHLQLVGGGTITFESDTDAAVNVYFDYAKKAGMPLIVATCDPAILPRVERHAIRHDIKVAIHNHGPEDKHYPSPLDVLKHVRGMDARMGLCIDIGHTVRAGTDVVEAIRTAGPRLHDLHLKDLRDLKRVDSQCVVGEGAIPIADILQALVATRFQGCANLEYEIDAADPLPGMHRSLAYLRGVLAGLDVSDVRR